MRGKVFLDTNVFVYTQSKSEQDKRDIALNVIENKIEIVNVFKRSI